MLRMPTISGMTAPTGGLAFTVRSHVSAQISLGIRSVFNKPHRGADAAIGLFGVGVGVVAGAIVAPMQTSRPVASRQPHPPTHSPSVPHNGTQTHKQITQSAASFLPKAWCDRATNPRDHR